VREVAGLVYRSRLVPDLLREARRRGAARAELLRDVGDPPTTFGEKVRLRMATDRRRILTTFADKVAVRDYVAERAGSEVLTDLYAVTRTPEQLPRLGLPREFALKAAHACGGVVLVADCFPPENRLPEPPAGWPRGLTLRPEALDWDKLVHLCWDWLARRYNPYEEWAYSKVKQRILVEELLLDSGRVPPDYKLFVFDGRVHVVQVDLDRFGKRRRNLYTPRWELLDVRHGFPRGPHVPRPPGLERIIAVAEQLGGGIDFVRVDLYNIGERVVFGELTVYPTAGWPSFDPPEFGEQLGAVWQLPRHRGGMSLRLTRRPA
jgi:TupA-like ATPgrasp